MKGGIIKIMYFFNVGKHNINSVSEEGVEPARTIEFFLRFV